MNYFILLFIGALVTSIGTGMTTFALSVLAYQIYGNASMVAAVQLAGFAPIIFLAPVTGVMADRFDRRLMMVIGDAGSVLGLAVVLLALQGPEPNIPLMLTGLALSSSLAACTEPALRATVQDIVPSDRYQQAAGMLQMAASSKFLISPIAASTVLFFANVSTVIVLDMLTGVVTVALTVIVRRALGRQILNEQSQSVVKDIRDGYMMVTTTKPVWNAVLVLSALIVVLAFLQTLLKPILLPLTSVSMESVVETVAASGLFAGAFLVALAKNQPPWRLISAGCALIGLAMMALPALANVAWIAGSGFLVFAALSMVNAGGDVIVRTTIPNAFQGRAWGFIGLFSQLGFLVGYGLAGFMADVIFEPLMADSGLLARSLGQLIGTGTGRGAALLVGVVGVVALGLSVLAARQSQPDVPQPSPRTPYELSPKTERPDTTTRQIERALT